MHYAVKFRIGLLSSSGSAMKHQHFRAVLAAVTTPTGSILPESVLPNVGNAGAASNGSR